MEVSQIKLAAVEMWTTMSIRPTYCIWIVAICQIPFLDRSTTPLRHE